MTACGTSSGNRQLYFLFFNNVPKNKNVSLSHDLTDSILLPPNQRISLQPYQGQVRQPKNWSFCVCLPLNLRVLSWLGLISTNNADLSFAYLLVPVTIANGLKCVYKLIRWRRSTRQKKSKRLPREIWSLETLPNWMFDLPFPSWTFPLVLRPN